MLARQLEISLLLKRNAAECHVKEKWGCRIKAGKLAFLLDSGSAELLKELRSCEKSYSEDVWS